MKKQSVLITGATGLLGQYLIKDLSNKNYHIYALSRSKKSIKNCNLPHCKTFDNKDFINGNFPYSDVDFIIHTAFARAHKGGKDIADSLFFTSKFFNRVAKENIPALINISSQEVYGDTLPRKENEEPQPSSIYGTAKYYSELLTSNLDLSVANLRLAGIIGVNIENRMVSKLITQIINGKPITVVDANIKLAQIDIIDVVEGITALIQSPHENWKHIYNLGYKKSYTLKEIVHILNNVSINDFSIKPKINWKKSNKDWVIELDSEPFYKDTHWTPSYDLTRTIKNIFNHKIKNRDESE